MAVTAQKNGQLVPKSEQKHMQKRQEPELVRLLAKMGPAIQQALPAHINADRMSRIALTALRTTPKLVECSSGSFLGSILQSAQLGLEVNTPLGHAYLIPFENRRAGTTDCQLIIGYQGMLDLARRSGEVSTIYGHCVYEGDIFEHELGTSPRIHHVPQHESEELTHVYAVAKLKGSDEPIFTVLTRSEVEKYRARSRAKNFGPWRDDYDAMALKTAVRRLFRWLPKSSEMARAAAVEQAPEVGQAQSSGWDPAISEALTSGGVDMPNEPSDPDPPVELVEGEQIS